MIGYRHRFIEDRACLIKHTSLLVDYTALYVPMYAYTYIVRGAK